MAVHKLFDSEKKQDTESGVSYQVTFYSADFSELQSFIQDNYAHNTTTSEYGLIKRVHFRCEEGIHYCDVEGSHDKDENGILFVMHTENGPDKHEITSVMMHMPLERLAGYRTCWNHYLWVSVPEDTDFVSYSTPAEAETKTTVMAFETGGELYMWSDCEYAPSMDPGENRKWYPVYGCPKKPGVSYVDYYTYQITEEGDHSKLSSAYWVMKEALTKPGRPILGTMGVEGGSWKCDHASIRPNGKRWRSRLVWTWSPGGWDSDLYPVRLKTTN